MRRREDFEMVKVFFLLVGLPFDGVKALALQETALASSKLTLIFFFLRSCLCKTET